MQRSSLMPFMTLPREWDRLFDLDFASAGAGLDRSTFGATDITEKDDVYSVEIDVPGFSLDDFDLSVMNNELRVVGTRQTTQDEDGKVWHRRGRETRDVSQVLRFPVDIDVDKVEATLTDGVLRVTLPKADKALPKKVTLK